LTDRKTELRTVRRRIIRYVISRVLKLENCKALGIFGRALRQLKRISDRRPENRTAPFVFYVRVQDL